MPESLEKIGADSFLWCTSLEYIDLPENLASVGDRAFADCLKLRTITLPESICHIGEGTFSGCYSLESINVLSAVTYIGYYFASGCTSLRTVNLPSTLEILGEGEATLAAIRANQANAAAEELKSRNDSYEALAARVLKATKSEDEVTLDTLADEIMTMTSASYADTVKIPADPDIGDLSNEELLYYVARALYDMSAALATY